MSSSDPAPPATTARSIAIAWSAWIVPAFVLLTLALLAWVYLRDTPLESDEDLRPSQPIDQTPVITAPRRLRAFLDSVQFLKPAPRRPAAPWDWDTPTLARWVRSNGTALDNLRDLLEDDDWHPRHSAWHADDLGAHPIWPQVRLLLQAQSAYLARRADEQAAFTAILDLVELGRRLQEIWAWPSFMEHALESHAAATQGLAELLRQTCLNAAELERFQREFALCQPSDSLMRDACAAYYGYEKRRLLGPASGEPLDTLPGHRAQPRPAKLFFKPNQTLALFASAFRDLRDEITRPAYTRLAVNATSSQRVRQTATRFYQPNADGVAEFAASMDAYLQWPRRHHLAHARHRLIQVHFALRRFAADHAQRPPVQLEELVPTYLEAVPNDPFSDEPLRYEPASDRLYSVGVDLIAEGGRITQPPLNDPLELTLEIGLAKP